eukprot:TRINITY_DN7676_c0_g1_i1.p1 TRINITY_DN7676_c0_g1~~TRINITY_DN7676_c0_g1_i1.p1  ORF type:complete len:213 (+),score=50.71 TRINITY_DN7676_c0_g1_i1:258-896(+)
MARGISQTLVGHPLDTMKVRLQTQSKQHYTGLLDCIKQTFHKEGPAGFYKGASSPIAMSAIYSATLFLAYGQSKRLFHDSQTDLSVPLPLSNQLLAGALTGTVASFVEGPMDLFKCKMQVQQLGSSSDPLIYRNAMDAAFQITRTYGIKGVYRGLGATICRNIPGTAVYFTSYELVRQKTGGSTGSILLGGGVGGLLFWLSVYPLDVIKLIQ